MSAMVRRLVRFAGADGQLIATSLLGSAAIAVALWAAGDIGLLPSIYKNYTALVVTAVLIAVTDLAFVLVKKHGFRGNKDTD
jgi:hypothetical protein